MDHQQFNDAIADVYDEDDPEIRNWLSTQHGRKFTGVGDEPVKGICPRCEKEGHIATRRRNSAYVDDALNWLHSCEECFEEDTANFAEMWADYHSMVR